MRALATSVALLCTASGAVAQSGPMPASTVTPDAFVESLGGERIRTLYYGVTNPFLFELQDRDVANLFSYGMPPEDRTLATTDIAVTFHDSWTAARDFYTRNDLLQVAENLPTIGDEVPAYVNMTTLTLEDRDLRFYTFVRSVSGVTQDGRCMARLVIDDTYVGAADGRFDSFACSTEID